MCRIVLLACVAVAALLAKAPVHAGEKTTAVPALVVRVQSLNALMQNLGLVVKLVGQEEVANQIEGLVKSKIGVKGLEGVDPTRAFGAYVRFGKAIDEINGAMLVPITDQKTFLKLLDTLDVQITKDKDDIYTYKTNKNVDVYFRFAHKYLFITSLSTESIRDKNLLDPAKALGGGVATISLVAQIDQIPKKAKLIAIAQLGDAIIAAQKQAGANETKAQEQFRIALLRDINRHGNSLIRETKEIRFDLDIDEKTKELAVQAQIFPVPGSELAKTIDALGKLKSPLAGLTGNNAAFHGAIHLAFPETLTKSLGAVIDEAVEKSLDGIQNPLKKKQADTLFKAILPSAKAGEYQLVALAIGPKKNRYTFLGAMKLTDGEKLGNALHNLLKEAINDVPPEQRDKFKLDIDKVGTISIHRLEVPRTPALAKVIDDVVGDNQLHFAFRNDAVFFALGEDALATIKALLVNKTPATSVPMLFDFDIARMASLIAQTPEQRKLARTLFPAGETGRIRASVNGGASLTARLQMRLSVLEFLAKVKDANGE
ncbi:MAG: hypothetical protein EXS16_11705 [Gemmataceae bacterium]|nr:hypothetical protein [Gemmataceae bacterium]